MGCAAVRWAHRLWAGVLLSTAFVACEKPDEPSQLPLLRLCVVNWSGTLATDASAFNVRACWNYRCSDSIPVRLARSDAGSSPQYADASCVPTTPGGLPARCNSRPITPPPGCSVGEIDRNMSLLACARAGSDGADVSIHLTPATEGFPVAGDQFELTIETTGGDALVDARARMPLDDSDTEERASCRGARFDLKGDPIPE
jgi:hypothetical protein